MWQRTRRCAAILAGLSLAVPARSADGPRVRHDGVGCVLAGVHPRLRACFPPGMETGRAQVQFRAEGSGPWYGVDMKADGACRSAVLPIPRRETAALDYFIEVADA